MFSVYCMCVYVYIPFMSVLICLFLTVIFNCYLLASMSIGKHLTMFISPPAMVARSFPWLQVCNPSAPSGVCPSGVCRLVIFHHACHAYALSVAL